MKENATNFFVLDSVGSACPTEKVSSGGHLFRPKTDKIVEDKTGEETGSRKLDECD